PTGTAPSVTSRARRKYRDGPTTRWDWLTARRQEFRTMCRPRQRAASTHGGSGCKLAARIAEQCAAVGIEHLGNTADGIANRFDHLVRRQVDELHRQIRDEVLVLQLMGGGAAWGLCSL